MTDAAKQFVVDHGYDPAYGARPQKHVETMAAKIILGDQELQRHDVIVIDVNADGTDLVAKVQKA